jgi:hypothetical protein
MGFAMMACGRRRAAARAAVILAGWAVAGCSLSSDLPLAGLRAALEPLRFEPAGAARAQAQAQAAPRTAEPAADGRAPVITLAPEAPLGAVSPAAGAPGVPVLPGGRILGQSDSAVLRLLGRPALRRAEPPGEMWQYVVGACVMHLFLYPADRGAEARVQHAEATMRGRTPTDVDACIADLRARRRVDAAGS